MYNHSPLEQRLAHKAMSASCFSFVSTSLFLQTLLTHILRVTAEQSPPKLKSSGKYISEEVNSQVTIDAYYTTFT